MKKKLMVLVMMAVFVLSVPIGANAGTFSFEGNTYFHNQVVFINFNLSSSATDVRVWTDSFDGGGALGGNFDPITALWDSTGNLIGQNDDNSNINPATQTYFDSGFSLASLAAGSYTFSMACYNNFASGTSLSDGFRFDGDTPIAIGAWSSSDVSTNGLDPNIGTYWHIIVDGVDSATGPINDVPEPATMLLLGLGLMGLAGYRRMKK